MTQSATPAVVRQHVPGLRGLKFLGSRTSLFKFFSDPVGVMQSVYRTCGRIGSVIAGDPSIVCAFGAEYNQRFLSDANRFHNFAEVPFPVPAGSALEHVNISLTAQNGEQHRRNRRLMMPPFNKGVIAGYRDDMVDVAEQILARWPKDGTLDISDEMVELTLLIAMRCLFGLDLRDEAQSLGHLGMSYMSVITSPAVMLFPVKWPGTPYTRLLGLAESFAARLRQLIQQRRASPTQRPDVLSLLINSHDEDGSALTDDELVSQASLIFVAGHETTAFTLAWTLFLLSQHPRVYADLVDELDGELHGAAPTVEQLDRLPLLDGVIKEGMRLIPTTPFLFLRVGMEDFELGPYRLPKGSRVALSPLITHRLPEVFPDPDRFLPERWQGLKPSAFEYLPFGAGPRMCLGAGFATLEARLVLAMIVQRFRLSLLPEAVVSRHVRGIILGPKFGLPMRLAPQDRAFTPPIKVKGDIPELVALG